MPQKVAADFPAAGLSTDLLFECEPDNTVRVLLRWTTFGQGQQWVDLSLLDNNFAPGTFLSAGPLPATQSGLVWDGLLPGALVFARVNTLTPSGWSASPMMAFLTPTDCSPAPPVPSLPPPGAPGCAVVPASSAAGLAGCVTTTRGDFAAYSIGDAVVYCYAINQPMNVRVVATRPDATQIVITNGFDSGAGGCVGPFQANVPLGLRTVTLFGGPANQLLAETHFFVR
jgi:hypothetical protein